MKFRDTNIISVIREFNLPVDFGTNFQMKNYVLISEIINESPNRFCVIFVQQSTQLRLPENGYSTSRVRPEANAIQGNSTSRSRVS